MDFYFSAKGRICRKDFWLKYVLVMLGVYVVFALVIGGLGAVLAQSGSVEAVGLLGLVALPIYIAMIWVYVCVSAKRFHDRNMSGWWALWFILISLAPSAIQFGAMAAMGPEASAPIVILAGLLALVIAIAQIVILGFLPGTKGPNQYGPDPLDPNAAASAEEVFS